MEIVPDIYPQTIEGKTINLFEDRLEITTPGSLMLDVYGLKEPEFIDWDDALWLMEA